MSFKLFDDHPPRCEYCVHARLEHERLLCARKRVPALKPCGSFSYDPLKRVPRQEARLPEYRPEDFAMGDDDYQNDFEEWQANEVK